MNKFHVKNAVHVISFGLLMGIIHSNFFPLAYGQTKEKPKTLVEEQKETLKTMPINERLAYETNHNDELLAKWQNIKQNMGWAKCSDSPDKQGFALPSFVNKKIDERNASIKMTVKYECISLENKDRRQAKFWATYRDGNYDFTKYELVFEDVYSKYQDNDLDSIQYNLEKFKTKNAKRERIRSMLAKNETIRHHVEDLIYRNTLDCFSPTIRFPLIKGPMNKFIETPQTVLIETKCAVVGKKGQVVNLKVKVKYKLSVINEGEGETEASRFSIKNSKMEFYKSHELGKTYPSQQEAASPIDELDE